MNKKISIIILALILVATIILTICFCKKKNAKEEIQPIQKTEAVVEPIEQKNETTPKIKEKAIEKESAKRVVKKSEDVQRVVEDLGETKPINDSQKVEPVKDEALSEENVNQIIEIKSTYSSKNSGSIYYRNVHYNIQIRNGNNVLKESINDANSEIKQNTEEIKTNKMSENAIIWR